MLSLTKENIIELYQTYNEVKPNIYGAGILSPKS
jgi:hypothetical protein